MRIEPKDYAEASDWLAELDAENASLKAKLARVAEIVDEEYVDAVVCLCGHNHPASKALYEVVDILNRESEGE